MMREKRTLREEHVGPVDMFFVYLDLGLWLVSIS